MPISFSARLRSSTLALFAVAPAMALASCGMQGTTEVDAKLVRAEAAAVRAEAAQRAAEAAAVQAESSAVATRPEETDNPDLDESLAEANQEAAGSASGT